MVLKDCKCKCKCREDPPSCTVRVLFWIAILPSIGALLYVYLSSIAFYGYWRTICTLNAVFLINCVWFAILCPAGFFLLQFRVTNRGLATLYTLCLASVIICCIVCILMSTLTHANLDDSDNHVVKNIKEYFADKEEIPLWIQEIQEEKKCCGISGPKDWKELIYPVDKPGVEDVPLSCCIVKAVGCNLIIGEFSKTSSDKSTLAKWVHVDGCRKPIEMLLDGILGHVVYGSIILVITAIFVLSLYWWQLVDLWKEEELVREILLDLERKVSGMSSVSCSSGCEGRRSRRSRRNNFEGNGNSNRRRSGTRYADDDDGIGDLLVVGVAVDNNSEYSGPRSP